MERKTASDKRGWLRTAVAFANSVPVGYPAVLFIGVRDDGTVAVEPHTNLEKLQKTFSEVVKPAYPPISYFPRVLTDNANQFLAVIVPGSPGRPHFAGQSYVRVGPESRNASEAQFESLIAQRQSKAYAISEWIDKTIVVEHWQGSGHHIHANTAPARVLACNALYVTYAPPSVPDPKISVPLSRVEVSFDHENKMLKLEIRKE